jgi:hypothetical protein
MLPHTLAIARLRRMLETAETIDRHHAALVMVAWSS